MSAVTYLLSLGVGIGVGLIYALVGVKSPAPPIVALIGLLGMVLGEAGGAYLVTRRGVKDVPPTGIERAARHPSKDEPR